MLLLNKSSPQVLYNPRLALVVKYAIHLNLYYSLLLSFIKLYTFLSEKLKLKEKTYLSISYTCQGCVKKEGMI